MVKDVIARNAVQGASTITQQFVKNALAAQQSRTIFQKLRESALAYHLEREWSKDKILTQYLNSIYFGEGAYGIEAAAKTFFGEAHEGCGGKDDRCASQLLPHEAALLAGIISSPEAYSPRNYPDGGARTTQPRPPEDARAGRDHAGAVRRPGITGIEAPLPEPNEIKPPREKSESPYFTSWLRQQVVDYYGPGAAFGGGLHIKSTLDLDMQREVEEAVYNNIGGIEPTASVVVIDNATGGVLAMVGGEDYNEAPFNLATNGQRQPGSAMKPFTLVTALGPGHLHLERLQLDSEGVPVQGAGMEEDGRQGPARRLRRLQLRRRLLRLLDACMTRRPNSDNSVYAELGLQVGPEEHRRYGEGDGDRDRPLDQERVLDQRAGPSSRTRPR